MLFQRPPPPLLLLLLLAACCPRGGARVTQGTVYFQNGTFRFQPGLTDRTRGAAVGQLNETVNATGWGTLDVAAGLGPNTLSDEDVAYAAGLLEGALTAQLVRLYRDNLRRFWTRQLNASHLGAVERWLVVQDAWARRLAASQGSASARLLRLVMRQFDGLVAGVDAVLGRSAVSRVDLLVLQAGGDISDISTSLTEPGLSAEAFYQRRRRLSLTSRCSALIKVTPGLEDMLMAHATWFTYSATLRLFKHLHLQLKDKAVKARRTSFSSYPGVLVSLDDFYMTGARLVILQTTNSVFERSLYSQVTSSALLAWQRVLMANWGASDGLGWARLMTEHNSGTYNNQYMVVDLKRVRLKLSLDDGALTVVEQVPGLVVHSDQTPLLRTSHWPSYNVPFHEVIYNLSGYPELVEREGVNSSYQLAPRAKLFRRDAPLVANMADLQRLMRSNDYRHDPYSADDPTSAICARGDLSEDEPEADGCYDAKATTVKMANGLRALAISGPTTVEGTLPPFSWLAPGFAHQPHEGLPPTYNFNWTAMRPKRW